MMIKNNSREFSAEPLDPPEFFSAPAVPSIIACEKTIRISARTSEPFPEILISAGAGMHYFAVDQF
ncbi:hypothetical protein [Gimesia sp.]|uniref:hypothetical protein n=1 Tax=Gimesia sp. TaxID=2024833 RepID=UPI000C55BCBF|nr:hypothetical protein [Gimesia sp.]MAX38108.1 hypothetical protein [Gimesia sp.]HAH43915.1 hypothetical protein [Planctomycetaceae bacterium]HBL45701.1 hypothetical protein [Planctomycetaceae bacterium]|tara:strand:- start:77 stop:274 length:198 start_codon:yes stop_codon:yes gene_type:complete